MPVPPDSPSRKNRYGDQFVRLRPTAKVDHVELDPVAALIIRDVAQRILADETGTVTVHTEAARLNRAGVLSTDHRSAMYGRKPKGTLWNAKAIKRMLITSEASRGYLMHHERPVTGPDGHAVPIADPQEDHATRHPAQGVRARYGVRGADRGDRGGPHTAPWRPSGGPVRIGSRYRVVPDRVRPDGAGDRRTQGTAGTPGGMRWVSVGRTVERDWLSAPDDVARREILMEFDVRMELHPGQAKRRFRLPGLNPEQQEANRGAALEHQEAAALAELEDVDPSA
ncbi:hypothetical protein ACFV7Q_25150 [Streptomyces sp. NPDC059851]|uniref:hypothetical protein n=1 Tax=Streptomyces sp. NPDC059851 TaxID=3346971 RepID=UPI003648E3C8